MVHAVARVHFFMDIGIYTEPPPKRSEESLGSYVESLTRFTASLLVLMYGIGFLILSIHEASFGILQFSPLRARIIFVGFTFAILTALPVAAHRYGFAYFKWMKPIMDNTDASVQTQRRLILSSGFVITTNSRQSFRALSAISAFSS